VNFFSDPSITVTSKRDIQVSGITIPKGTLFLHNGKSGSLVQLRSESGHIVHIEPSQVRVLFKATRSNLFSK
jgi:hypothetical protein